jgi:hypothetical protein
MTGYTRLEILHACGVGSGAKVQPTVSSSFNQLS